MGRIPDGSLGTLGESKAIERSLQEQHAAAGRALDDISELIEKVRESLAASAEMYRETNSEIKKAMDKAREGIL